MGKEKKEEAILTKREFIKVLAGSDKYQLINENNEPLDEMVHPLAYSLDNKKHPDMQAVPMSYKYSRNFKKLVEQLKRT
ncbi:MAG: hypothetical protein ACTSWX_00370 [Promethearchaeota archaeon]